MGRDEREVILVEREGGSVKWLLLGAAVGAGLALLFAPKPGKELRQDLGRRIRGLKDLADETLAELKMEVGAEEDEPDLEGGAHPEEAEAEPVRRPVSPKAAAREELERRLAAARARRRQAEPADEEPVA